MMLVLRKEQEYTLANKGYFFHLIDFSGKTTVDDITFAGVHHYENDVIEKTKSGCHTLTRYKFISYIHIFCNLYASPSRPVIFLAYMYMSFISSFNCLFIKCYAHLRQCLIHRSQKTLTYTSLLISIAINILLGRMVKVATSKVRNVSTIICTRRRQIHFYIYCKYQKGTKNKNERLRLLSNINQKK